MEPCLAGVAATPKLVLTADRELGDTHDAFHALDAATGTIVWTVTHPAPGRLDYGNSPRATPLIDGERVFLLGAFGHLHAVELATGRVLWQKDLRSDFQADDELVWGVSASPLVVDGKLIVSPGGKRASLAALEPATGEVLWEAPGDGGAFASPVAATLGGRRQLIGYDKTSLGGWDMATGRRLWRLVPPREGDFNVPTPVVCGQRLLVATENNAARLYGFDGEGRIVPQPLAVCEELAPDTHTPVAVGRRLFAVAGGLHCLDLDDGLKPLWRGDDPALHEYASLVASGDRLLITTLHGALLLVDAQAGAFHVVSRRQLFEGEAGLYSHPAVVGDRLYIRGSREIVCLSLGSPAP